MKIHRKCMALTIVEVLVAVAIVLALAAITHSVLTKVRNSADNSTCLVRLRTLQNAVDLYRSDWGNASATSGRVVFLGLPHDPWKMLYTLSTDEWERYVLLSCPLISGQLEPVLGIVGIDWVPSRRYDNEIEVYNYGITFAEATRALGGETPVFVDPYHNLPNLPYNNRGVRRFFLYTTLDSNVRSEYLVGINVETPPSGISLSDWVRVKSQ